jgi:hypothetical protein
MAKELTVNSVTYSFPDQGENPRWGKEVTGWAQEVTDVIQTLLGTNDITNTTFSLTNNQAVAANITGLLFSTSSVRSATISYSIYISSSTTEIAENGRLYLNYKPSAGTWNVSREADEDAGVVLTITNAGQVQYTTTNIGGTGYLGQIKFKAETFTV